MQFGNNSASSNSNTFPPKTNNNFFPQFPMNPFMNMMSSMTPFPSFGFPSVDVVQMKLMQSMFEKFVQAQMQRAPNVNPSLLIPAFENQFLMAMLNENFLKAKTQPLQTNQPNDAAEQMTTPIKEEFILNQLGVSNFVESNSAQPITNIKTHLDNKPRVEENKTSESPLKPEEAIREMLLYFVKHIGTVRRTVLEKDGESIHRNNEELKEIFMGLMKKFLSSRKTKEEKIKYVLRKCFKFMKDKLLEETGFTFDSTDDYTEKLNSDKVDKMFFKHYFSEKCGKQKKFLTKNEITFIKDISMPFRKNSQNKTMNIDFLRWVFSNDSFFQDYKLFLTKFNDVTNQDNIEKIGKTAKKIQELMETKNYRGFSQKYFKRMPWLDIWRIEAKEIALNLIEVYAKPEGRKEVLESTDMFMESLEPIPQKKIKTDSFEQEVKTQTN